MLEIKNFRFTFMKVISQKQKIRIIISDNSLHLVIKLTVIVLLYNYLMLIFVCWYVMKILFY